MSVLDGNRLYIASEASGYTTGEIVLVDGGMNAVQQRRTTRTQP